MPEKYQNERDNIQIGALTYYLSGVAVVIPILVRIGVLGHRAVWLRTVLCLKASSPQYMHSE